VWAENDTVELSLTFNGHYWICASLVVHGGEELTWITTSDELCNFLSAISELSPSSWPTTRPRTAEASP
jgi:hypothetical protein